MLLVCFLLLSFLPFDWVSRSKTFAVRKNAIVVEELGFNKSWFNLRKHFRLDSSHNTLHFLKAHDNTLCSFIFISFLVVIWKAQSMKRLGTLLPLVPSRHFFLLEKIFIRTKETSIPNISIWNLILFFVYEFIQNVCWGWVWCIDTLLCMYLCL